jgi:hypothetical protein
MAKGDMGATLSMVSRREVMGRAVSERRMKGRTELEDIAKGVVGGSNDARCGKRIKKGEVGAHGGGGGGDDFNRILWKRA